MQLFEDIKKSTQDAVETVFGKPVDIENIAVQHTRKDFDGDVTIVVFPLLKISKKPPEETAEMLGNYLKESVDTVSDFNVVKGFLNLVISDSYWVNVLGKITENVSFGIETTNSGKTIMVEYSQPNTNKPLHLGHLRNNMLGYSLANILMANGHKVIKANIINDRGIHICKSMLAWLRWGKGETPESTGLKGDHLVGKYYVEFNTHYQAEIKDLVSNGATLEEAEKTAPLILEAQEMLKKWEAGDSGTVSTWKEMNSWVLKGFDASYKTLGVDFDEIYYESNTYLLGKEHVAKGLDKGYFYKKDDGSVWCDLKEAKLDPKLLLRSDGTSVYITQDIGTAVQRFEDYKLDRQIYVVGNEQNHHFQVLFAILKKMGYAWAASNYHLSYGMVELPSGKMKSREGTVVDADDIMDEMVSTAKKLSLELGKLDDMPEDEREELFKIIGLGALKYYLLKVEPKKQMLFDPEESIDFNGHTGPFIQYSYTRIQSLVKKAGANYNNDNGYGYDLDPLEKGIIKLINQYPSIIKEAGDSLSPALIANYVYELAKEFNHFYQSLPILKLDDEQIAAFRINLAETTGRVIKSAMNLLGIDVPDQM